MTASNPDKGRSRHIRYNAKTHDVCYKSLDFVINTFFMKLFRTSNIDIVKTYQSQFTFDLPSIVIEKRVKKFNKSLTKSTPS